MSRFGEKAAAAVRRRTFLQAGGLAALGLTLPDLLKSRRAARAASRTEPRAKSCVYLYMTGGPAQQETFDMKPGAPEAPRGEFQPIATNVPGVDICERLPLLARCAEHYAIVRSVHHDQTFHGAGAHYNLTGFPHAPREPTPEFYLDRRDWPTIGAVVERLRGNGELPAAVHLPYWIQQGAAGRFAGQDAGFLGAKYDPLRMFYEGPHSLPGTLPPDYRLPVDVPPQRLAGRVQLLESTGRRSGTSDIAGQALTEYQAQAVDILTSGGSWRAFCIDDEQPETIARYGDHKFGRSCLVARRLVEAGVGLVTVAWPGEEGTHFDTHADHFRSMREDLLPPADRAFSALLEDLDRRGLLDETIVVWAGEFGRTPALNGNHPAGRDHWPYVYSTVLAGGGIRGGQILGASDDVAAHPQDRPVHVSDFVATIYHALGYGADTHVADSLGRTHSVVRGKPVLELF